jgi:phage tail-like protein
MRSEQWLVNQLPVGMAESDFFTRFVSIFQEVASTLLDGADNIGNIPDATVTPTPMVRTLGSWIGSDSVDPSLPEDLQRRIVRSTARTLTWRGTARGLREFLEMMSGSPAEVSDGGGVWRESESPADTAWVRMQVETTGWMSERDFAAIVADEIPAHVRAELWVGDRLVWPEGGAGTMLGGPDERS